MLAWRDLDIKKDGFSKEEALELQRILEILSTYLVLLFSLSVHESAHAWTALRMGDETAFRAGRISLNPLVHMDPFGTVVFPLVGLFAGGIVFGWAKPVPIQPRHFTNVRQGEILSAGAGPFSNFVLAVAFAVLYSVMIQSFGLDRSQLLVFIARIGIVLNVVLGIFNLIPVPPLDGSHIASWGLPRGLAEVYGRVVRPYGFMILVLLLISGALDVVFDYLAWPVIRVLMQFGGGL